MACQWHRRPVGNRKARTLTTHDKVNDLMARMRTCAAYITSRPHDAPMPTEHLLDDAAALLIEAAALLESYQPNTTDEPMEIIPPPSENFAIDQSKSPAWTTQTFTDPGVPAVRTQPVSKNACPNCDSRTSKTVHRVDNQFKLECPVCGARWPVVGKAEWR
jgi:hypothetical protein